MGNKKVYISGKITGLDFKEAVKSFKDAEDKLTKAGYIAVNPMAIEHDHDLSWESYMKADIKELLTCDYIFLLHNWESSTGAVIEVELADKLSIARLVLPITLPTI